MAHFHLISDIKKYPMDMLECTTLYEVAQFTLLFILPGGTHTLVSRVSTPVTYYALRAVLRSTRLYRDGYVSDKVHLKTG